MLQSIIESTTELTVAPTTTPTTFSDDQQDIIYSFGAATAGVSILGSTFIIISYISFPRLRSFAFELILMVALSDFLKALSFILTPMVCPSLCEAQALLLTFSEIASIFWIGSIAFTINRIFSCEDISLENTHRMKYHFVCWGTSIVMTMLPLTTHSYEVTSETWCWITFDTSIGKTWAFVCYYIPVWLILYYLVRVYYKFWIVLKNSRINSDIKILPNTLLVTETRMAVYPTIFFFTIICACLDRMFELVSGRRQFCLVLMHIITINLGGLANAIVYGLTKSVWLEWIAYCCPNVKHQGGRLDHYVCFEDANRSESTARNTSTDSTYLRASINSEDLFPGIRNDTYNSSYRSWIASK